MSIKWICIWCHKESDKEGKCSKCNSILIKVKR